jgi:hypothetical protein
MATATKTAKTAPVIATVPPKPGHSLDSAKQQQVRDLVATWHDTKAVETKAEQDLDAAKTALLTARVQTSRIVARLQKTAGGGRDAIAKLLGYNTKGGVNNYFLVAVAIGDRALLMPEADVTDEDREAVRTVWKAEAERQAARREAADAAKAKAEEDAAAALAAAEAATKAAEAEAEAAKVRAAEAEAKAAEAEAARKAEAEATPEAPEQTPEGEGEGEGMAPEDSTPEAPEAPAEETPEVPAKVIAPTFAEVIAKAESLLNMAGTYTKAEDAKAPTKAEADRLAEVIAEVSALLNIS